jgi:uncharacterized protein (DUF1778 family)
MAQARKQPGERKDYHLRIPLSAGQRALIERAAALEGVGRAGWARALLLAAARRRLARGAEDQPSKESRRS